MVYKVVLTFTSLDETLACDHSKESYWTVLSCVTVTYDLKVSWRNPNSSVTTQFKVIYYTCEIAYFLLCWFAGVNAITYFLLELRIFVISPPTCIPLQQSPECQKRPRNHPKIIWIKTQEKQPFKDYFAIKSTWCKNSYLWTAMLPKPMKVSTSVIHRPCFCHDII